MPAYIAAFLVQQEKDRYRCRVCGREWEKHAPEKEGTRPRLVRQK